MEVVDWRSLWEVEMKRLYRFSLKHSVEFTSFYRHCTSPKHVLNNIKLPYVTQEAIMCTLMV